MTYVDGEARHRKRVGRARFAVITIFFRIANLVR
jgi:hypothetical protein